MAEQSTPQDVEQVTEADLESFIGKLEAWGGTLPPHEKAVLSLLIAQASAGGGQEVQGYLQLQPFNSASLRQPTSVAGLISRGIGVSASDANWLNAHWLNGNAPQFGSRVVR